MNTVAIASIGLGILIIATRGPLIFAPEGTARVYRQVFGTAARTRILACVFVVAGAALWLAGDGAGGGLATAITVFGWVFGAAGLFLVIFPATYMQLLEAILDGFDSSGLRAGGVLGAAFGALFIYLGVTAL
jgi:hypothetical protein